MLSFTAIFFLLAIKFQNTLVDYRDMQTTTFLSFLELRTVIWSGSGQSE